MGMLILFLGVAALLGTASYFLVRRVFWDTWTGWRQKEQEAKEDQWHRQHMQALRHEALDSVLAQIERQDDHGRKTA